MTYIIGSLNCRNYRKSRPNAESNKKIAQIIKKERFDIVALQEFNAPGEIKDICRNIGVGWRGECDNEVNEYAYLWNTNRVDLPKTEVRENRPRIYKQYKKIDVRDSENNLVKIVREPYFARFVAKCDGGNFEIRLLNTHIRFSKNPNSAIDCGGMALRRNELDMLTRYIYAKEADRTYDAVRDASGKRDNGEGRPAYTFLIGDYNLNVIESGMKTSCAESMTIIDDKSCKPKEVQVIQYDLTTLAKPNNEELIKQYANNYDHVSYDRIRFGESKVTAQRVDAVNKYCNGDFEQYYKLVSDHLPIRITLNIKPER